MRKPRARRLPKEGRGKRAKKLFQRWFVLLDGDGDVVSQGIGRAPLEGLKESLEKSRPCGKYRIEEKKWRGFTE